MDWCGSVCDWADENFIEPLEEEYEDAKNWFNENMVDPIEGVTDEVWDFMTETVEDFWEDVKEFSEMLEQIAEEIGNNIEKAWDEFKEEASNFLSDLWDDMEKAWSGLINTLEEWGEWIKEQVDSAVEWLKNAAEAVYDWVVEDLIPWVISLIMLPWVIAKFLAGLIALGICWLISKFTTPEPVKVIQAITEHHPRTLEDFRIVRLPVEDKYVVFSDLHMFVKGDFDYYNNNRNSEIHRWLLAKYASDGYHLIDNGDIEDFWMRGGSLRGHILSVADVLPYPYHYQAYINQAAFSALQVHALNIFYDNAATYALVDNLFVAKGKYTRTIGNHDDAWDKESMIPMFDFVYQTPIFAYDYVLLDNSRGDTEVVIAHGHQSDVWNMQLCDFAGKAVTESFSTLMEISVGLLGKIKKFYVERDEWKSELDGNGFDNELHKMEGFGLKQSLDEIELYKELEEIYSDSPRQPYLILGHTHNVKDYAGVPKDNWNWNEYSNSGTTGMWEKIVLCLEIDYPNVKPVAWYLNDDDSIQRHELNSYRFGDCYLR